MSLPAARTALAGLALIPAAYGAGLASAASAGEAVACRTDRYCTGGFDEGCVHLDLQRACSRGACAPVDEAFVATLPSKALSFALTLDGDGGATIADGDSGAVMAELDLASERPGERVFFQREGETVTMLVIRRQGGFSLTGLDLQWGSTTSLTGRCEVH